MTNHHHPEPRSPQPPIPEHETLVRYRNRDGDRQVLLTLADGDLNPFSLSDAPAEYGAPGVYFLLDSYATREAAQEAAEAHADAAVELGTYEARALRACA